jgi:DNA topoisomerase-1
MERDDLNRDHVRLYEIIWKRALASQAKEAVFDSTTIVIKSSNGYEFQTQGSVVKFEGFLKITGRENGEVVIPSVTVGESLEIKNPQAIEHLTNPPPRYTEASLVKTLEEKDIGRPSTYAPIISTVIERNYVIKEEKKLVPTELGEAVTDFLVGNFPDILSLPFTAKMEGSLDEVANGQRDWVPVISDFYTPFIAKIEETYKNVAKVKMTEEVLDEKCPKCGNPLVVRIGKFGKFIACTTYPKCDYTRQLVEKIDMKCPRCGGDIIIKKSRMGKTFYGCSNYPKCNFAAWRKEDIK